MQERLDGPCGGALRHELAHGHAPAKADESAAKLCGCASTRWPALLRVLLPRVGVADRGEEGVNRVYAGASAVIVLV